MKLSKDKISNILLSILMCSWSGVIYFLLEVFWKTIHGEPEKISWTMLILAIVLSIPVERFGAELPWKMSLLIQSLICATAVTIAELLVGILLNIILGMGIWDYSHMPFNFLGQICLYFFILWYFLCFIFIQVFDWIRYFIKGGQRPIYKLF